MIEVDMKENLRMEKGKEKVNFIIEIIVNMKENLKKIKKKEKEFIQKMAINMKDILKIIYLMVKE